jgi:hypothetical protein
MNIITNLGKIYKFVKAEHNLKWIVLKIQLCHGITIDRTHLSPKRNNSPLDSVTGFIVASIKETISII